MSTIKVDTVQSRGGGAVTLTNQSASKSWVNFNGTGTIATRDSFNIASLTDNATGDYSCNFSNAMSNANYIPTFGFDGFGASEMRCLESSTSRRNTTALVGTLTNDNAGSAVDINFVYVTIHGDLA